jgi:hypothetical protein
VGCTAFAAYFDRDNVGMPGTSCFFKVHKLAPISACMAAQMLACLSMQDHSRTVTYLTFEQQYDGGHTKHTKDLHAGALVSIAVITGLLQKKQCCKRTLHFSGCYASSFMNI